MIYWIMGLGGIIGASLRYLIGEWIMWRAGGLFPVGTLIINFAGSFILAFFYTATTTRFTVHPVFRSAFGTGFIGSFTTFSTFSRETTVLISGGHLITAGMYVLSSLVGGFLLTYAGVKLGTFEKKELGNQG